MMVSHFIQDNTWNFPATHAIEDLNLDTLKNINVDSREDDKLIWTASDYGEFSMKGTYFALSHSSTKVFWSKIIWFKGNIPRQSFIAWLACHKRLKTREKLLNWGIIDSDRCLLCQMETEN